MAFRRRLSVSLLIFCVQIINTIAQNETIVSNSSSTNNTENYNTEKNNLTSINVNGSLNENNNTLETNLTKTQYNESKSALQQHPTNSTHSVDSTNNTCLLYTSGILQSRESRCH